ncbi:MAG TPA: outer membrane beta-barrel protein [Candidatus Sulfotelmatobacter sp.]|nr:outer membrane beta-barrel protein [Candidatus Sulfotelmatobacter sp.]
MIGKFAVVPGSRLVAMAVLSITILAGGAAVAQDAQSQPDSTQQPSTQSSPQQDPSQQAPAQQGAQQPANPQSGSEEASPEEITVHHRVKPKEYKNWNFNVGGGASVTSGMTKNFARGGGGVAAAGVARNFSKYFGFRLDFQYDNLPLRNSALLQAQATGANSHVYALNLDPIINLPVDKTWSGYVLFGPGFYHRTGKLDSSTAVPGGICNSFFIWWGRCYANSLPLNGDFLTASQNEFGYNVGAGVARKVHSNIEIYADFRIMHGNHNNITTDVRPITMGVRW